jgi:beta-lactamase superfamily II metal-dependent hydrolase
MSFLHADAAAHSNPNENSLVISLELGATRILFVGDAEAGGRADPSSVPHSDSIEGILLACCTAELRADILVVGHHGSMTSSRKSFLDAVGAKMFVVSGGPTKYGQVTLPDRIVVTELESRGKVFRTDLHDDTCSTTASKVGTDNDGEAGGCDNVLIEIGEESATAAYSSVAD